MRSMPMVLPGLGALQDDNLINVRKLWREAMCSRTRAERQQRRIVLFSPKGPDDGLAGS